jgi:hypothetical protein
MSTQEEQEWYKKFYEGTFLVKGWKGRMEEILQAVPSQNKEAIRDSLESLGEKIGREWSKENRVRRIDSAMLKQWGEALGRAKKIKPDILAQEIAKIGAEVDKILA